MNKTPLVSIVCNTYNHQLFIRDAIEGFIIQQTSFPFEILIHDDCSTDNTANIVREYEMKYPDIIFPIYQERNQYSFGNHPNLAFQFPKARGKYIALCEGDDYWTDPLKLQKQYDFLEVNPDFVMCYHKYRKRTNYIISEQVFPKVGSDFSADELIGTPGGIATSTKFFRNVFLDRHFEPPQRLTDFPLNAYLGLYGKCKFLNHVLPSVYRVHAGGVWSSKDITEKEIGVINAKIWIYNYFKSQNDHYRKIICLRALYESLEKRKTILYSEYKTFKINFARIDISYKGFRFYLNYLPLAASVKKILARWLSS